MLKPNSDSIWYTASKSLCNPNGLKLLCLSAGVVIGFDRNKQPKFKATISKLTEDGVCNTAQNVERASAPRIRLQDAMTKFDVDIFVNDNSRLGIARESNRMMKGSPGSRQLSLIVKHFLSLRENCQEFTSGAGEYAIVCLVVNFLGVASNDIDPLQNLGALLLDMFRLYGTAFNWEEVAIDLRGNGPYCGKSAGDHTVTIKEPLNVIYRAPFLHGYRLVLGFQFAFMVLSKTSIGVEAELRATNFQALSEETMRDPLRASMLCSIVRMTPESMQFRDFLVTRFIARAWLGQIATETFSFV